MRLLCRLLKNHIPMAYNSIVPYQPPAWCSHLKKCPTHRVNLAQTPTPIHLWNIQALPEGVELSIKRDDLTGSTLSGNKVRKLEFLLADAIKKNCTSVITCGGLQSNHCRATALAAAQLGLRTHLLLRTDLDIESVKSSGNLFLAQMCNSAVYLVPRHAKFESELKQRQAALAKCILQRTGELAYSIGVGGSDVVGLHGYLNAWDELMKQGVQEKFDDVVVACGSGGSIAGITIGNYLTGGKVRIHAVAVCDNKQYFNGHIDDMLEEVGLEGVKAEDICDIIEGYKGAGYGLSTPEDHQMYRRIASRTGICCDPVYTGKAIKGLIGELRNNLSRFQGNRILFVHTGGIFGLYDGRMFEYFDNEKVGLFDWKDINKLPSDFHF